MTVWLLLLAAAFLSLERICYVYISHAPDGSSSHPCRGWEEQARGSIDS